MTDKTPQILQKKPGEPGGEKAPFNWEDWRVEYCEQSDPEIPNQHCQREKGHDGRHESYSREWE